jgi:cytidine deaminase
MNPQLTKDEKKLVEHAKKAVVKYNKKRQSKGGIDTLYSFVMSDSGKIYDGACLETTISSGVLCAERHAIANMILQETYSAKIKSVVVADPVPKVQKNGTTPCGTCRHVIWELGVPDTTIICMQYIRHKDRWTFPKLEKHTIKKLYPNPYKMVNWDL